MHYDFGLRSVKAVVLLARDYLKKERRYISFAMFILSSLEDSVHVIVHVYSYRNDTAETVEKKALLQALQDSELSKLLSSDAQVMNMLLWDLFKVDTQETTEDILKVINAIVFYSFRNICEWLQHQITFPKGHAYSIIVYRMVQY